MLKENDVKAIVCADCGAIINVDDEGNLVPIEVLEENENYIKDYLGRYVCKDCMEDYAQCEDCGNWVKTDDGYFVGENDDYFVCEDCFEDYIQCEDCGHYHPSGDMYYVESGAFGGGYYVCDDCRYNGNYYVCDDCGNLFYYEDLHYDEYHDTNYCDNCYPYHHNELIMGYHEFDDWQVYGEHGITKGFELEIETDEQNDVVQEIHEILDDFVVFEEDGSVDGVEMISNPFTRDYWAKNSTQNSFKKVFKVLNEHDCGICGCGLHVHVNRTGLATDKLSQDDVIDNIIMIMETFKNELTKFSRRCKGDLREWASFLSDDGEELTYKKIKDKKRSAGRYVALNLQKGRTIEFRIFKSTMRYDEFMATLELVDNIVDIARSGNIDGLTWNDIVNFHGDFIQDYVNDYGITSDKVLTVVESTVEPISDIIVGDFVTVSEDCPNGMGYNNLDKNKHYQVIDIDEDDGSALLYHKDLLGHDGRRFSNTKYRRCLWWVDIMYLKPIIEEVVNTEQLNVGDRVLVKDTMEVNEIYGVCDWCERMNETKNKVLTVDMVDKDNSFQTTWSNIYYFTPQMIHGRILHGEVCNAI